MLLSRAFLLLLGFQSSWSLSSVYPKLKSLLIAFRPESRHTDGFSRATPYALPRLEFLSRCRTSKFRPLQVEGNKISNWFILEGVEATDASVAVRSCILAHSVYEIWSVGSSMTESTHNLRLLLDSDCKTTAGACFQTLGVSTFDAEGQIGTSVDLKTRVLDDYSKAMSFRNLNVEIKLIDKTDGLDQNAIFNLNFHSGIDYLSVYGHRLAFGPAADPKGSMAVTKRRPNAGILARFALSQRNAHVSTSMEPELAFVMANLARVDDNTRYRGCLLDPFCGSCALLLCAAHLIDSNVLDKEHDDGSKVNTAIYGIDASSFNEDKGLSSAVEEDFARFGLRQFTPQVSKENILNWRHHELQLPSLHAIVTDPPYGVKASPVDLTLQPKPSSTSGEGFEFSELHGIYKALLDLAVSKLEGGGRLVLFVPEPFFQGSKCALKLIRPIPPQLRLVHVATQVFRGSRKSRLDARVTGSLDGHFRRSLVVLEKK